MALWYISVWHACDFIMLHVQMEFDGKAILSFLLYFSLMTDKLKKHKGINNGSYGHGRARFRDLTLGRRSIIKAHAYYLKSTNSFPAKF